MSTIDVIQNLFPDKQMDFVISINETDVALIKQLSDGADVKELQRIAKQIATAVTQELGIKVVIGIGTVVNHIRIWPGPIRRPGWPSMWARYLTRRSGHQL